MNVRTKRAILQKPVMRTSGYIPKMSYQNHSILDISMHITHTVVPSRSLFNRVEFSLLFRWEGSKALTHPGLRC